MEYSKKFTLILLMVTLCLPALAADGDSVKEAATGVSFSLVSKDGLVLMGTGVRKKLVFNVYAAALYVSADGLKNEAADAGMESLNKAVRTGALKRRLLLHFVRDVPAEKVRRAFRDSLVHNMSTADYEAEEKNIEDFLAKCPDIKKGKVFSLSTSGNTTRIMLGFDHLYTTSSRRLSKGLWGSYFGERPICEKLRKGLLSGGADIIGGK